MTYNYSYKPHRGAWQRFKAHNGDLVLITALMLALLYFIAIQGIYYIVGGL